MNIGADGAENGGGKHVILDVERIRRDEGVHKNALLD